MDCEKLQEETIKYLYDDVSDEVAVEIEMHAFECERCRAFLEFQKEMLNDIQESRVIEDNDLLEKYRIQILMKRAEEKRKKADKVQAKTGSGTSNMIKA